MQTVSAIGLSPSSLFVDYIPGGENRFSVYIVNNIGEDINARIYTVGNYKDLVEVSTNLMVIKAGEMGELKATLRFPLSAQIEPGEQHVRIGVIEDPILAGTARTGVVAKVGVEMKVRFIVPFPGKYAKLTMEVSDINLDEELPVKLKLRNLGRETINFVDGQVELSEDGKIVKNVKFDMNNILSKQNGERELSINTTGFRPGNYQAIGIADYDGIKATAETIFRIGSLFINLTNYSKSFEKDKVVPFDLHIQNRWNDMINDVHAEITITKEGQQVASLKTPSISLNPWEHSILRTFWDTNNIERGEYDAFISIKHLDSSSDSNVKIHVYEKIKIELTYILIGVIILIILVDIIWLVSRKKRTEEKSP